MNEYKTPKETSIFYAHGIGPLNNYNFNQQKYLASIYPSLAYYILKKTNSKHMIAYIYYSRILNKCTNYDQDIILGALTKNNNTPSYLLSHIVNTQSNTYSVIMSISHKNFQPYKHLNLIFSRNDDIRFSYLTYHSLHSNIIFSFTRAIGMIIFLITALFYSIYDFLYVVYHFRS